MCNVKVIYSLQENPDAPARRISIRSARFIRRQAIKGILPRFTWRSGADLASPGSQATEDGYNLLKFHGSYEQYDRDTATARKQIGEEKDYSFMLRVRMPGGILTAAQYLALDRLSDQYSNGILRITRRQGVQFH